MQTDSCSPPSNIFKYFKGDTKTLFFNIFKARTLTPVDLTNCEEIVVNLPNADGTFTQLLLSMSQVEIITPALLGQASAEITETLWPNPFIGEGQNIDVTYTINSLPQTVRFEGVLYTYLV